MTPNASAVDYERPACGEYSAQQEIKRSQFIGLVTRVTSTEQARDFIQQVRHRYPDARHHCSAFIIHQDGAQPIERSNDDGEPSGTAGQPMLDILRGYQDICVVVVRYFGGVLLGTGGLVRAYQDTARMAVEATVMTTRMVLRGREVRVDHAHAGRLEADIRNADFHVMGVDYGEDVCMTIATRRPEKLEALVAQSTAGQAQVTAIEDVWLDQ